jgi:hypothetical protein
MTEAEIWVCSLLGEEGVKTLHMTSALNEMLITLSHDLANASQRSPLFSKAEADGNSVNFFKTWTGSQL